MRIFEDWKESACDLEYFRGLWEEDERVNGGKNEEHNEISTFAA
jgi:hypothetical protein